MNDLVLNDLNVSRETFEKLEIYVSLLRKWSPKINLISKTTLNGVWARHIQDSLQVLKVAQGVTENWVDLGTGGGFPGLVVAICATDDIKNVTLIEADQRKAAFLRTVLRKTESKADIIARRIEDLAPQSASVVSARALAPLPLLLGYTHRHLEPHGTALLPKGITWKKELEKARESFSFEWEAIKSCTQDGAVILRIREISRV